MNLGARKILQICALLFICVVLVGVAFFLKKYLDEKKFLSSSEIYENTEQNISFHYSNLWEPIPADDLKHRNEKFIFGVYIISEPSTAIGLITEERKPEERFDYDTFVQYFHENFSKSVEDYKEIHTQKTRVNGYPAVDFEYTYRHLGKAYVHQRQRIIITPEKMYYLSASVLVANYEKSKKEIDQIFRSFTVIEKKS